MFCTITCANSPFSEEVEVGLFLIEMQTLYILESSSLLLRVAGGLHLYSNLCG